MPPGMWLGCRTTTHREAYSRVYAEQVFSLPLQVENAALGVSSPSVSTR